MTSRFASRFAALLGAALCTAAAGTAQATATAPGGETRYRAWIAEMKESPRGPFAAIKWFCKDGRVLPPNDFACAKRDAGWQHGQWSERTLELRGKGYLIATLLAGMDVQSAVAVPGFADDYAQWLVERYLIATDNGWIMRRAQFYRGAIQEEDEREFARALLVAMAARDEWIGRRFLALRTGVRLLPHGADNASAQKVRQQAAALADRDASFAPLRVKIHGSPAASDATAVREYAARAKDPALANAAKELATAIDALSAPTPL
ncbi:MAG: phosphoenolpyruvate synthase, partial [Betaproteobacteria bacterium]